MDFEHIEYKKNVLAIVLFTSNMILHDWSRRWIFNEIDGTIEKCAPVWYDWSIRIFFALCLGHHLYIQCRGVTEMALTFHQFLYACFAFFFCLHLNLLWKFDHATALCTLQNDLIKNVILFRANVTLDYKYNIKFKSITLFTFAYHLNCQPIYI